MLLLAFAWPLAAFAQSGIPQPGVATLPPPSDQPLRIDFSRDPFLRFLQDAVPPTPFREQLGAAVAVHPAVAAAIADQAQTAAVRTEVRSGLFPRLDAQLVAGRSIVRNLGGDKVFVERLSPTQRSDAVLAADQLLFDFGATSERIAAASQRVKAAQAEVARVATETGLRGVSAYYDVLTYQSLIELNAATVQRHRDILGDTRSRFKEGLGSASDVARAEAFLADVEVQGVRFQRRLDQARSNYREVYGVDAPLRPTRPLPPPTGATSLLAAQTLSRDAPAVSVAAARAAAAREDWRAAKSDRLPRISAALTGSLYDLAGGADNYDVRGQLVLRQTFSTGGAEKARATQARARFDSESFAAERIANETARDAGVAWTDIALLEASTSTLRDAYQANRRSRDMFVEQFRVSRGSLLDLLRAEQDFFGAAANYLQGTVELDVSRYVLLARTGEFLPVFGVDLRSREVNR